MKIEPYLCGAISGIRSKEAEYWRSQASSLWPDALDPMRRKLGDPWLIDELVVYDKLDIEKCTFLLLRWRKVWPISAGACMEVLHAYNHEKLILVWKDEGCELPAWVDYHVTYKFNTLEQLHEHSCRYFGLPTK